MIKKALLFLTLFLSLTITPIFSQNISADVRTGISFTNVNDTLNQTNFVKEAYLSYDNKISDKFAGNVSVWFDGQNLNLYTANLTYTHPFSKTTNLKATLGGFENAFYSIENKYWNETFINYPISADYFFGRTTTGLEVALNTKYVNVTAASTSTENFGTFKVNEGEFLFTAEVNPASFVSLSGFFRTVNKDNTFGGLVNLNKTFKKVGHFNLGGEVLTNNVDTSLALSSWLEYTPAIKVLKNKVSLLGRYDNIQPNTNVDFKTENITVGLICSPVENVKIGTIFSKTLSFNNDKYSLLAQILF